MSALNVALRRVVLSCLMCISATSFAASRPNPDVDRLNANLSALDADPALGDLAAVERLRARQSVSALMAVKGKAREQALWIAMTRVETAQLAAQAELLVNQAEQLDRERDQIMLQASQRDAEMARREADQLRLQNMARQEEAERMSMAIDQERLAREQSDSDAQLSSAEAAQARKLADARAGGELMCSQAAPIEAEAANAILCTWVPAAIEPPHGRCHLDGRTSGKPLRTDVGH